jgi:hypothetical protein
LAAWQPSSLPFPFSHFLFISSSWLSRDGGRAASSYFISCQSWHPPPAPMDPARWGACSMQHPRPIRWDTQKDAEARCCIRLRQGSGSWAGRHQLAAGTSDWMACCAGRGKPHQRLSPVWSTLTRKRQEIVRKTLSALLGLPGAHAGQTRELGRRTKSFFVGRDGWSKIR